MDVSEGRYSRNLKYNKYLFKNIDNLFNKLCKFSLKNVSRNCFQWEEIKNVNLNLHWNVFIDRNMSEQTTVAWYNDWRTGRVVSVACNYCKKYWKLILHSINYYYFFLGQRLAGHVKPTECIADLKRKDSHKTPTDIRSWLSINCMSLHMFKLAWKSLHLLVHIYLYDVQRFISVLQPQRYPKLT